MFFTTPASWCFNVFHVQLVHSITMNCGGNIPTLTIRKCSCWQNYMELFGWWWTHSVFPPASYSSSLCFVPGSNVRNWKARISGWDEMTYRQIASNSTNTQYTHCIDYIYILYIIYKHIQTIHTCSSSKLSYYCMCLYICWADVWNKYIDTQVVLVLPYQVEALFLGKRSSRLQQDSNA